LRLIENNTPHFYAGNGKPVYFFQSNMKQCLLLLTLLFLQPLVPFAAMAKEFHVSVGGSDNNDGSPQKPYKTISAAAQVAQPGDVITVHEGVYRERISPPRGGASDDQRIVYQAASGEKVEIAGSEAVGNWAKVQDDVWKTMLPNTFFGDFNPYSDLIHGDWFNTVVSKQHHTGMVYLNGDWMFEAPKLDDVLKPASAKPLWFAQVDKDNTTIWAQFKGVNPNEQRVEINVRKTVFYPEKTGMNYITVRGFTLRDAATPWAPPTAEQIGLIGTNWSKGWIIENNVVTHSTCAGISLGKYGDEWDNKSANSAGGYVKTVDRAVLNGWTKENIGHHIVRNNTISYCDQAGVVGSLGAIFSEVTGNHIFQIANRGQLNGAEMAGIKFHAAIDVLIKGNRIHDCILGMWMDWMAQGVHITGNLCYQNNRDLMMEVDHGPFLVDNNLFLSRITFIDVSEEGAFAHNLIAGTIDSFPDKRTTEYFQPHSPIVAGLRDVQGGGYRFFNNIFVGDGKPADSLRKVAGIFSEHYIGFGLGVYDTRKFPLLTGGNIYYNAARAYIHETNQVEQPNDDPKLQVVEDGEHVRLQLTLGQAVTQAKTTLVTTALLGKARVPNAAYENPDASPLQIDTDYFGKKRDLVHPSAGPFENPDAATHTIEVW